MQCPTCRIELRTIEYEGVAIDLCDACDGQWLDGGELRHIVKAREVRFDAESRRAVMEATKMQAVAIENIKELKCCPKCGTTMTLVNFGGDSGIVIDRCHACRGVWLDAGELEKIQMVAEAWEDHLPAELARHGAVLRTIERETVARDTANPSRFGFVNAAINGIVDVFG